MRCSALRLLAVLSASALVATSGGTAFAEGPPGRVVGDRVAVRWVSPETGGSARPRFLTERELAFFTRVEALVEQNALEPNEYPDRYVRAAVDRIVARSMLAGLMVQRGVEPPDTPRLTHDALADLEARVGPPGALAEVMKKEGIEMEELLTFLRDEARAAFYVDRAITPILAVTEDALREAFRSALHPFRGQKFDDVRQKLRRWLVSERLRAAEVEFLQSARARIKISPVRVSLEPRDRA